MKKIFITLIIAVFALSIAGCGGGGTEEPKAPAEGGDTAAPKTEEAAKPEAKPAEAAAPASGGLAGTVWKIDQFEVTFKGDSEILVKGGPLAAIMPDGATGTYKLDGKAIELSAMGKSFKGTWDGTKLVVDGTAATKQ